MEQQTNLLTVDDFFVDFMMNFPLNKHHGDVKLQLGSFVCGKKGDVMLQGCLFLSCHWLLQPLVIHDWVQSLVESMHRNGTYNC